MAYLGRTDQDLLSEGASGYVYNLARHLRRKSTPAEQLLWEKLRNRKLRNIKFRRQHPFKFFIADFYSYEIRLVIELDGKHHQNTDYLEYDQNRTAEMQASDITVIRFSNHEVINDMDKVLAQISKTIDALLPSPSKERGRG